MSSNIRLEKIGPYRIEVRLGAGGMGTVYRAYDERLRRRVAIKHLHPERAARPDARERFLREARATARLNHPALVQLHDILETEEGEFLVMEWIEGTSLDRLLKDGPMAPSRALALALQVAGGLAAAHAAGLVHRDLKAENIVVTPTDQAKLLDFGLSEFSRSEVESDAPTVEGRLSGTPRAMSPEQAQGQTVDSRSDLFSLGTLIYEMVTGHSPFLAPSTAATLARVCHERQEPTCELVLEVPPELSELIDRLLEKDPSTRPQSAVEVVELLEQIENATDIEESPEPLLRVSSTSQTEEAVKEPRPGQKPFTLTGERRQLTVLCCELTGATLDPELLFEILPGFQSLINEAIERYEGKIYDVQGHRLVACFGYPRAHEDNARRAILAALEIITNTRRVTQGLTSRVGVHTGPAVVLWRDATEHLVMGKTLDLATLLQEKAKPEDVLITGRTRRLIEGFFDLEIAEGIRGSDTVMPIEVSRVVAARDVHNRIESAVELTPFVGREGELDFLAGRFELSRDGAGQAVLLTGELGIGKTRLLRVLQDRLTETTRQQPLPWITVHGSPYFRHQSFYPVASLLRRLLEIDETTPPESQRVCLEERLTEMGFSPSETVPLFATLLGLPTNGRDVIEFARLQHDALEAIPAFVLELAEQQSTVLVLEDLHSMDAMTLELINRLVDQIGSAALLLILTCRPSFQLVANARSHLTQIRLAPLSIEESQALVGNLEHQLAPEVRDQIVTRADGVPLFVEELTRDEQSKTADEIGLESIPDSLRDALESQLDQLGTARELVQIASVLAPMISRSELAAISMLEEMTFELELNRTLSSEILIRHETPPPQRDLESLNYQFARALFRHAAQSSLLTEDTQRLLRLIGI